MLKPTLALFAEIRPLALNSLPGSRIQINLPAPYMTILLQPTAADLDRRVGLVSWIQAVTSSNPTQPAPAAAAAAAQKALDQARERTKEGGREGEAEPQFWPVIAGSSV